MKKKTLLNLGRVFLWGIILSLGLICYSFTTEASEVVMPSQTTLENCTEQGKESLKIVIMNDFHYFSKELYSDCEDFNYASKSEKKLLLESEAILNKVIDQVKQQRPDVILVGGDISKDSERINHEKVAMKLKLLEDELAQNGLNTQVYVTNGNHDINSDARDYSTGETVYIDGTSPAEFKEIYKDLGFGTNSEFYQEIPSQGGGLSYVTDIGKGFTLIVVDTNKYTSDQTISGLDKAEVGGMISDNLLSWIKLKAKEAYAKGNIPIVMQHHPIIEHFEAQELIGRNFIIDDKEKISKAYEEAGINIVFTGHSHGSDIALAKTPQNKVYDVMTSSLVGYPVTTRTVNLSAINDGINKVLSFKTDVHFYDEIDYIDPKTGNKITDLQAYAFENGLGNDATEKTFSKPTVENALTMVKNNGGTKGMLAKILKVEEENVTDKALELLLKEMPTSQENAFEFKVSKFKFGVYYNQEKNAIYLKQKVKKWNKLAVEVYIPVEEIKLMIEDLYKDIDKNILDSPDDAYAVFDGIYRAAKKYKFNGNFSSFDYYQFCYTYYKSGRACSIDEQEKYIEMFLRDSKYTKKFIKKVIYKSCKKEMVTILKKSELDIERVLKVGNNSVTSKVVVKTLDLAFDDMGDVWTKVAKRVLYSKKTVNKVNEFFYYLVNGMASDDNVIQDNDACFEIVL